MSEVTVDGKTIPCLLVLMLFLLYPALPTVRDRKHRQDAFSLG